MSDKPMILRRLKTKDGVISPIEVMHGYRYEEVRVCDDPLTAFEVSERLCLDSGEGQNTIVKHRRYLQKKTIQAILIEMEEV